ncbi:MAG: response regulator transcription factor, partial [bacterium]|nr:response regulator transcription factor [bacterium]
AGATDDDAVAALPRRPRQEAQGKNDERKIRVLLVDDHAVMRQGLAQLLKQELDIHIVGEACDGHQAVEMTGKFQPDVVLMDINMPRMNGVEATRAIHADMPQVKIIGLSMFEEAERAAEIRKAGAVAYLSKSGATERVISAIREAAGRSIPIILKPRADKSKAATEETVS